jgi:hypothetical protein
MKNFIIVFALLFLYACECAEEKTSTSTKKSVSTQQKKVGIRKTFSDAYPHDQVRHVNEKGIHYVVIYYTGNGGVTTLNYTKDSLEIELLKKQYLRDSLQVEVFKKYLRTK